MEKMITFNRGKFSLIENTILAEDGKEYITYGIKSDFPNNTVYVNDITINKKDIENLIESMDKYEATEENFHDIIEDYLLK